MLLVSQWNCLAVPTAVSGPSKAVLKEQILPDEPPLFPGG